MKSILLTVTILLSMDVAQAQLIQVEGNIVDENNTPMAYADVSMVHGSKGTITNSDGTFTLSVSPTELADTLKIDYLGYGRYILPIRTITAEHHTVKLTPFVTKLESVEVSASSVTPVQMIQEAVSKIQDNYQHEMVLSEGFYREKYKMITRKFEKDGVPKKMGTGYKVMEALLDVYQPAYQGKQANKKASVKLIKGRQVQISKKEEIDADSVVSNALKSISKKGGPLNLLQVSRTLDDLDFLRNKEDYDYQIAGHSMYKEKPVILINFDQKENIKSCKFKGSLLLDANTLAFVEIEYGYSMKRLDKATHIKILGIEVKQLDDYGKLLFQPVNGEWMLKYAKCGENYEVNIERKMKGHKINASMELDQPCELLITGVKQLNPPLPSKDDLFHKSDQLQKYVTEDKEFWKGYTVLTSAPLETDVTDK